MRASTVFVLLLVLVLVSVDSSDARGRGGGRRGSRGGSRTRRSGSSKITKTTPIKPTKKSSPVIKLQTKYGSCSSIFKRTVVGYIVYRYVLSSAPVYRQGYPMYGSYVSIPPERAVRVSYVEEELLDSDGELCLGQSSEVRELRENITDHLVELTTNVTYKKTGKTLTFHGINNTVPLEDIKEEDFVLTSLARYNTTVVEGTTCTQVEQKVEGTMVQMYETNPAAVTKPTAPRLDGKSTLAVSTNLLLILSSIALIGFRHVVKFV